MEQLNLPAPALLFSDTSLILLEYPNRVLAYESVVRGLHEKFNQSPKLILSGQVNNVRKRLRFTMAMQLPGV